MIAPPPPAAGAPVEEALKEEDAPLPIFIFDEEEEPEACNIARAVGAPARVETLPVEERMPADEGLSAIEEHAVVASDVEAAQPAQREQPAIGEVPAPIPEMPVLPAPARVELPAPPATAGMRSSLFTRRGAGYRGAFGFLFLTGEALVWRPAEGAAPVVLPYRRIAALGCPPDGRGFYLRLDGDAATHAFQVDRGAEWVDEMYRALRGACRDPLAATMARAYMERRAMPA